MKIYFSLSYLKDNWGVPITSGAYVHMYTIVYKHKLYKYLLIVLLRSIIDEMFQSMKTDIICKDYRIQCLGHS